MELLDATPYVAGALPSRRAIARWVTVTITFGPNFSLDQ
jgi:hypothetical protein